MKQVEGLMSIACWCRPVGCIHNSVFYESHSCRSDQAPVATGGSNTCQPHIVVTR